MEYGSPAGRTETGKDGLGWRTRKVSPRALHLSWCGRSVGPGYGACKVLGCTILVMYILYSILDGYTLTSVVPCKRDGKREDGTSAVGAASRWRKGCCIL
ncbi:hypothetical protein BDZ85DRAFT_80418 [Elsinoe ampelina]|uniref:Uncharacterized protein n=1 Tax=Elsinoe ampelina TaxID=302913 RepID=A0A6A6FYV8_9PEZI|nr:hypothetical protein BDZ85DRAFT_80418 [Elsinoe ampelina]